MVISYALFGAFLGAQVALFIGAMKAGGLGQFGNLLLATAGGVLFMAVFSFVAVFIVCKGSLEALTHYAKLMFFLFPALFVIPYQYYYQDNPGVTWAAVGFFGFVGMLLGGGWGAYRLRTTYSSVEEYLESQQRSDTGN